MSQPKNMKRELHINLEELLYIIETELRGYGVVVTDRADLLDGLAKIEDCYVAERA